MNPQEEVLVIGLGSTLRGDDAMGRIAAERVQAAVDSQQVKVISQSTPTPELAAEMAKVSLVIFLDASADGPSDQIWTRQLTAADAIEPMAHRLDAVSLLGLTRHLYGHVPTTFAITYRGQSFGFSDRSLSPQANAACDLLVQETLRIVDRCSQIGFGYSIEGNLAGD